MVGELISAVAGAIVGCMGAYLVDIRKQQAERRSAQEALATHRRETRRSIATSLLQDLQTLEPTLRQFYNAEKPGLWIGQRPSLYFEALRSEVRHLRPTSIPSVTEFFRMAEDYFAMVDEASSELRARPNFNYRLRVQAGFALQALPAAKSALVEDGGVVPEPRVLDIINHPDLPKVPPIVFPAFSADGTPLPDELM